MPTLNRQPGEAASSYHSVPEGNSLHTSIEPRSSTGSDIRCRFIEELEQSSLPRMVSTRTAGALPALRSLNRSLKGK